MPEPAPLTRRGFLAVGGLALADRLLPFRARPGGPEHRHAGHGAAVEIAMRSFGGGRRVGFDPLGALVPPGGTVRWILVEGVHTATAFHPDHGNVPLRVPAGTDGWDSGYLVEAGSAFEVVLTKEGVYDYFCRPHLAAGMVGRIVVASRAGRREGGAAVAGIEGPAAETPGTPDGGELPDDVREALAALPPPREILRRGVVPLPPGGEG